MSKTLFIAGAFVAALALAAVIAGIWSADERWGRTAWALAAAAFSIGANGVFARINEGFS